MSTSLGKFLAIALGTAVVSVLATASGAQTPDPAKWAELQKKAKEEGQLVLAGPPLGIGGSLRLPFEMPDQRAPGIVPAESTHGCLFILIHCCR